MFSFNNIIKYIKSIDETLRPAFENGNMLHTMTHLTDLIIFLQPVVFNGTVVKIHLKHKYILLQTDVDN